MNIEQNLDITNIGTWYHDNDDVVYRFNVYKKVWTPYELEKKFSDESEFEDGGYYQYGMIKNVIEIPNDVLLEIRMIDDLDECEPLVISDRIKYLKLSDIKLMKFDEDQERGLQEYEEWRRKRYGSEDE